MDLEGYVQQIAHLGWGKEGYTLIATRLSLILERIQDDAYQEGYDNAKEAFYGESNWG